MVLRTTEVQGTEQAGPSLKGEKSTCRCLSYTPGRPGGILCWDSRTAGALPGQQSTPDPSSLGLPPKNCPRWRSPKHTLPSRLTRSHCNRLTLSWSCRKRMVSGGRGGAHLSGCRGYWGAVNSPHSACLVPLRTSSKIRAVEMRWLSWHKDLRAHVKPARHGGLWWLCHPIASETEMVKLIYQQAPWSKTEWTAPEELKLPLGPHTHVCGPPHTYA